MPMVDPYHRRIDYLRISVTDRCNLFCHYCKPGPLRNTLSHRDILTYEEALRLVKVAVPLGISRVRVTGGEPLVRRGIVGFIASLRACGGLDDVSLTTNGVLLEAFIDDLARAGLLRLNISLDSLDEQKFRKITGLDAWRKVWRGITLAEERGFAPLKLNMVPVRDVNNDEVVDFARLTIDHSFHVRFIEYMPIGGGNCWNREACVPTSEVRAAIEREFGRLEPAAPVRSAGPSDNYIIPGSRGVIGFISPMTRHFCDTCRRLRLTADGKIRPCLLSDTEIDIKSPMRNGCGNDEIERLLRLSLEIKPARHAIDSQAGFQRTMSRIGG